MSAIIHFMNTGPGLLPSQSHWFHFFGFLGILEWQKFPCPCALYGAGQTQLLILAQCWRKEEESDSTLLIPTLCVLLLMLLEGWGLKFTNGAPYNNRVLSLSQERPGARA